MPDPISIRRWPPSLDSARPAPGRLVGDRWPSSGRDRGAAWVGFGTTRRQKAAAVLVAVTCLPVVQDFVYGNESTWLAVGVAIVWWRHDAVWTGVPLGVLVALFAKPQLVPLLVWMLVWRRRALLGTVIAGALATIVGVAIAGPASYLTWLEYDQSQSGLFERPLRREPQCHGADRDSLAARRGGIVRALPSWPLEAARTRLRCAGPGDRCGDAAVCGTLFTRAADRRAAPSDAAGGARWVAAS